MSRDLSDNIKHHTMETEKGGFLVFVLDTENQQKTKICEVLKRSGIDVECFRDISDLDARLEQALPSCIVAKDHSECRSGVNLIHHLKKTGKSVPVILYTEESTVDAAVAAMRAGALDYFESPIIERRLIQKITQLAV